MGLCGICGKPRAMCMIFLLDEEGAALFQHVQRWERHTGMSVAVHIKCFNSKEAEERFEWEKYYWAFGNCAFYGRIEKWWERDNWHELFDTAGGKELAPEQGYTKSPG